MNSLTVGEIEETLRNFEHDIEAQIADFKGSTGLSITGFTFYNEVTQSLFVQEVIKAEVDLDFDNFSLLTGSTPMSQISRSKKIIEENVEAKMKFITQETGFVVKSITVTQAQQVWIKLKTDANSF